MALDQLSGKVAFITGAGSGLGAAFARRLAADGAFVVVNDINESADAVALEVNGASAVCDVTDSEALTAEIDHTVERRGRIDIMINNAGIAPPMDPARFEAAVANAMLRMEGRIDEMQALGAISGLSDAEWDLMIRTHLYGTFFGTRAALRHMETARSGLIVNISSVLGLLPAPGAAHYSAAKAAIIAFTKSTALEVAHLGIRANAVCPGYVDTPLLASVDDRMMAGIKLNIGMGRLATAAELAELVRFLCGPESSYSNGDVYPATGAYS